MSSSKCDAAIVIPAYNAERTITETLSSIQEQKGGLDRIEAVYLADDCSTDSTIDIARSRWKCSVPLKILRNEQNQGERRTVNAAVRRFPASVTWFFIIHADDIAKPNWLSAMLRSQDAAAKDVGSITASYDVLKTDGVLLPGENLGEGTVVPVTATPESINSTLLRGCWWKVSSCSIRVESFLQLGGFADMPQLGDLDFVIRLMQGGWSIHYIPLSLSIYRQFESNVSAVSFQTHRDITEWFIILDKYGPYLTPGQWRSRHRWLAGTLCRRMVRALTERRWSRAFGSIRLLWPCLRRMLSAPYS